MLLDAELAEFGCVTARDETGVLDFDDPMHLKHLQSEGIPLNLKSKPLYFPSRFGKLTKPVVLACDTRDDNPMSSHHIW